MTKPQGTSRSIRRLAEIGSALTVAWVPALLVVMCVQISCAIFAQTATGHESMVPSQVLLRTFHIAWRNESGTAFAIDRDGKQYLITARHVVKGINSGDKIKISWKQKWHEIPVDVVGTGSGAVDVTVLACPLLLAAPSLTLIASMEGLGFGQDVMFLGFPFGWDSSAAGLGTHFPLPFVKAGIVSAITTESPRSIYIDGHGNRGFSGGPVVFVQRKGGKKTYQVAGVVSYYPTPILEPIRNKDGKVFLDGDGEPTAYFAENPGLVVAHNVEYAMELIDLNPIGFPLPGE